MCAFSIDTHPEAFKITLPIELMTYTTSASDVPPPPPAPHVRNSSFTCFSFGVIMSLLHAFITAFSKFWYSFGAKVFDMSACT